MIKQKVVLALRRLGITLLALLPWVLNHTLGGPLQIPPPRSFPFDVSRGDSTLELEIRIREHRSYYFALQFDYSGEDDPRRVLKLVGKSNESGVTIPIHLKVVQVQPGSDSRIVFEETVVTASMYAHGFSEKRFDGNYRRMIASMSLRPGHYRMEARTIQETPEFSSVPSHLNIEYRQKF